jgi:hypothetical protein
LVQVILFLIEIWWQSLYHFAVSGEEGFLIETMHVS